MRCLLNIIIVKAKIKLLAPSIQSIWDQQADQWPRVKNKSALTSIIQAVNTMKLKSKYFIRGQSWLSNSALMNHSSIRRMRWGNRQSICSMACDSSSTKLHLSQACRTSNFLWHLLWYTMINGPTSSSLTDQPWFCTQMVIVSLSSHEMGRKFVS